MDLPVFVDKMFLCQVCTNLCDTPMAQKCRECFREGSKKQPPRQTGRTLRLLQKVDADFPNAIYVVGNSRYADMLQRTYPWLKFEAYTSNPHSKRSKTYVLDHQVWEYFGWQQIQKAGYLESTIPELIPAAFREG